MKKRFIFLLMLFTLIIPHSVYALYNGGSGPGVKPSSSNCPNNTSTMCAYNNMNHMTVLVSLYYFNENGTRDKIGQSVVYTNNNFRNISEFKNFNVPGNSADGYNATGLKNYFYDNIDNFIKLLNETANMGLTKANYKDKLNTYFVNYCERKGKNLSNCSQSSNPNNASKYGFRIIIEPYFTGFRNNTLYFSTIKEIARDGGMTNNQTFSTFSMILHTTFDDVSIKSYNKGTTDKKLVASINSGYGYNIIDFAVKPEDTKCDKTKVGVEACCYAEDLKYPITDEEYKKYCTNDVVCDKTKVGVKACCNASNLKYPITESEYEEYCNDSCKYLISTDVPKTCSDKNSGHIKDISNWNCIFKSNNNKNKEVQNHYLEYSNDYCAIYCKEEIEYTLPSGANVVNVGRYLTLDKTSGDGSLAVLNPIKFTGKKTCRTTNKKGSNKGVINRKKFESDFIKIEEDINNSYNEYLSAKKSNKPATEIASLKENVDKLIKNRESMINKIKSCSEYAVKYSFSPTLYFKYDEPVYGNEEIKLKKDTNTVKSEIYYQGGNSINSTSSKGTAYLDNKKLLKYSCNVKDGCKKIIEDYYPLTDWFEKTVLKNINYSLPDNYYRYISKENGRSYHKKEDAGKNYVDVGYSNLPIHYSTTPGDYEFNIRIESLGDGNKFNKFIFDKKLYNGKLIYDKDMSYSCTYKVSCDNLIMINKCDEVKKYCNKDESKETISCDDTNKEGINVIYRPISMFPNTIFLNMDGTSRIPGHNWNNEDLIKDFITNNRSVSNYDVYKLDPMYTIELTPTKIKEIRDYNKKMNGKVTTIYDDTNKVSTGILGYADYESMTCNEDGVECKSDIIRKWKVKGCAIKGSNYSNCGNSFDW